jgi:hypothetical protein
MWVKCYLPVIARVNRLKMEYICAEYEAQSIRLFPKMVTGVNVVFQPV